MGAFAVPRPQNPQSELNTYVLWQDPSGAIQVNWQDDETGWKGPRTYPALGGADNGTSIACLTPNMWPITNLQPLWDMSRCYFQAGGFLKEVYFNGWDWVALGNVPMP